MRQEIQKFHSVTLAYHQASMFESLIYPHHIISESSKNYLFEDEYGVDLDKPLRGYFAIKEVDGKKLKYFIEEDYFSELPIKVNESEEIFFKDSARTRSIVLRPTDITPFRIRPDKVWESNTSFLADLAPFTHFNPDHWTVSKIIAVMSYIGKTFCGVCSLSEFGKSSIYLILDAITQKCPVFQPRTVPGVLAQITGDGNMVFDEVHDAPSEVKSCMENFALQVAGNSPIYVNGAMKSKNTKPKYDVSQQSITFLYNIFTHYSDPEKQFWDSIWSNTKAMQSRFLRIKLDGKLTEVFDKKFDIPKVAEENRMFYINIAKHLLYLKELKINNNHKLQFKRDKVLALKGRHKIIYDEILWGFDVFSGSQEEFDRYVTVLNGSIRDYYTMIEVVDPHQMKIVKEHIRNDEDKILDFVKKNPHCDTEDIWQGTQVKEIYKVLKNMKQKGDIFTTKLDRWMAT